MKGTYIYTKTTVLGEKFLQNTGNKYRVVGQRPYHDKKGELPDGVVLTLLILEDTGDYGVDKNTGKPRENNELVNFDAYVLNGKDYLDLKKGDLVELIDFDEELSFAIGFDLIMRFKDVRKIVPKQAVAKQPLTHA